MFSVGQAFPTWHMHVSFEGCILSFLMRDSTEQGSRRGGVGFGARGSAYIIMDITSTRDEDLKKCNKPIPHFQHLITAKTYLLIQKQPSDT